MENSHAIAISEKREDGGLVIRFDIPDASMLDEAALAQFLGVTPRTIRRMVARYELPPPIRIAGRSSWFLGKVREHFEAAAAKVAQEAEREAKRLQKYS